MRTTSILVSAASRHGSTAEIAAAIGDVLQRRGAHVTVLPPQEVTSLDGYDAVVLGSAVYAGHWLEPALELAGRCGPALPGRPVWLFTSGPVGIPAGKLTQAMGVDPVELPRLARTAGFQEHRIFAGKLSPRSLPLGQRLSLLVFRGMSGDFRDWAAIRQWADGIADTLAVPAVPA